MNHAEVEERYRLLRPLGSGGEGSVWLAEPRDGGPAVALKHFNTGPGLHELAHALDLRHPQLVRALDYCYLPSGDAYLVYEYAAGGTLRAWMEETGPVPAPVALAIVRDVLSALAHLHASSVAHGDVKPENILRARPGADAGPLLLADFGTAHLLSRPRSHAAIAGSPAYMAPERFCGSPLAPAGDIYAVGVLLHELLSGRRPFDAADNAALARAHLRDPVPPLPADTAPEVAALALLMLEKDPRRRLGAAGAALHLIDGLPGAPRPPADPAPRPRPATPPGRTPSRPVRRALAPVSRSTIPGDLRRIHLIDTPALRVVAEFDSHLELHGIDGGYLHRMLPRFGPCLAQTEASLLCATGEGIVQWWPVGGRGEPLVPGRVRPRTFALSPDRRRLVWASGTELILRDLATGADRALPSPIVGRELHLSWLDDGRWVLAGDALRPALHVFRPDGDPEAVVELPGPLFDGPSALTAPVWITAAARGEARFVVVTPGAGGTWEQAALPVGTHAVTATADGVLLQLADHTIIARSPEGVPRTLGSLPLLADGLAISPSQRHLAAWRRTALGTEFSLHALVA